MRKFQIILILGSLFVCLTGVQAAELDEQVNFYVDADYDALDRTQLPATLRVIGENIYFYVENAYWSELSSAYKNSLRDKCNERVEEGNYVASSTSRIFERCCRMRTAGFSSSSFFVFLSFFLFAIYTPPI